MAPKLSKGASDRLLNLLYTTTSTEVATKVPIVTRYLYGQADTDENRGIEKSILDGLMENEWKQKPLETAVEDISSLGQKNKSSLLKFRCPSQYISRDDFYNIYPINRERKYYLSDDLRKGVKFKVIKGRDPCTLLHNGLYYLIFPNYKHACVYILETFNKQLNGFGLHLEFASIIDELKYMSSPWFDADAVKQISDDFYKTHGSKSAQIIFEASSRKSRIIKKMEELNKVNIENYEYLESDPAYDPLVEYVDIKNRTSLVLVRNLPFGLSKFALPKLLWDYDLAPANDITTCFTNLINDPLTQTHIMLIRFADRVNANRFARTFHGRKWESVQTEKEKKLYEPILCEVLD